MCVCVCVCIYYSNIYQHSRYQKKKTKKKTRQEQEIKVSRITAREKKKNIIGQKERKDQPRQTPWKKSRDTQSVSQKKTKTFRESSNATITRVLNTSGANYKINLNRESEIFY